MSGRSILRLFVIVLAWISTDSVFGQDRSTDSTAIIPFNSKNIERPMLKADSIQKVYQKRTDSLQNRYQEKLVQMDSLQDSIEANNIVQRST